MSFFKVVFQKNIICVATPHSLIWIRIGGIAFQQFQSCVFWTFWKWSRKWSDHLVYTVSHLRRKWMRRGASSLLKIDSVSIFSLLISQCSCWVFLLRGMKVYMHFWIHCTKLLLHMVSSLQNPLFILQNFRELEQFTELFGKNEILEHLFGEERLISLIQSKFR